MNRQFHDSDAKVFQPGASIIEADCCEPDKTTAMSLPGSTVVNTRPRQANLANPALTG
ncbi:hypothetical protein RBWH47_04702 [Rhodopirellula baltica WH47]|uniref:Uncharacterized protein n=1 Tax=Rhodopirellula baltica WH47 TaxID=991778 RepID=F2AYW6_RHOBT|nr:hypothetical protein RBWH47_04702 [Rhodopirellula baltica WH47]